MRNPKTFVLFLFFFLFLTTFSYAVSYGGGFKLSNNLNQCFTEAGKTYHISPLLLRSIAEVESGLNQSATCKNSNGTIDVGMMQVNSSWINTIGFLRWAWVRASACYNIYVGAWILAQCIQKYGYTWRAVACYHVGPNGYGGGNYTKRVYITYLRKYYQYAISDNSRNNFANNHG